MAVPTRIYLTGFMGGGKSTVGPLLAKRLGYGFVDLDQVIEGTAGRTIGQIFSDDGEHAFRTLESRYLRVASRDDRLVIALGGGAIASKGNLQFVKAHGSLVYLKVAPRELADRLQEGIERRPMLFDETGRPLTGTRLVERIREMMRQRAPTYEQADTVLDVEGQGVEDVVEMVLEALV